MRAPSILAASFRPVSQLDTRSAWLLGRHEEPFLRANGWVSEVSEGREIYAQSEKTDTFYKVVSGVVRICKFLNAGGRLIEAFHIAGEVFGLELGNEHEFSAEAVTDCSLIVYRLHTVERQAKDDHVISQQLFQHALQGLARAQTHSLLLVRRGAAGKVAAFLLDWTTKAVKVDKLHLDMPRRDIADYLGITIETVSRSLSQFERDGVIALSGARNIRVLKRGALQSLAA